MSKIFVVDFDPGLSGPFETEQEAEDWARRTLREHGDPHTTYAHRVVPVSPPSEVPRAVSAR